MAIVEITPEEASRYDLHEPDFIYFRFSIQNHLKKRFPESPIRIFVYQGNDGRSKYWFMVKDNKNINQYCMLAIAPGATLEVKEYLDCLRTFRLMAFGALDSNRPHLMIGKKQLIKLYSLLMRNINCDLSSHDLCMNLFYMRPEQKELILKTPIEVPEGYELDKIQPYEDAATINATWRHAQDGDFEQTLAKLVRLPSSCIRYNGDLAGFVMCDPAGYYNNLYVFEEHRRKGLAKAIEIDMAQQFILSGMTPYKTVDVHNQSLIAANAQSKFWSRWTEEDNTPVTVIFQTYSRNDE